MYVRNGSTVLTTANESSLFDPDFTVSGGSGATAYSLTFNKYSKNFTINSVPTGCNTISINYSYLAYPTINLSGGQLNMLGNGSESVDSVNFNGTILSDDGFGGLDIADGGNTIINLYNGVITAKQLYVQRSSTDLGASIAIQLPDSKYAFFVNENGALIQEGFLFVGDSTGVKIQAGGIIFPDLSYQTTAMSSSVISNMVTKSATNTTVPAANVATGSAGSGTGAFLNTTYTGGTGTHAYTVGDLVKILKAAGILLA